MVVGEENALEVEQYNQGFNGEPGVAGELRAGGSVGAEDGIQEEITAAEIDNDTGRTNRPLEISVIPKDTSEASQENDVNRNNRSLESSGITQENSELPQENSNNERPVEHTRSHYQVIEVEECEENNEEAAGEQSHFNIAKVNSVCFCNCHATEDLYSAAQTSSRTVEQIHLPRSLSHASNCASEGSSRASEFSVVTVNENPSNRSNEATFTIGDRTKLNRYDSFTTNQSESSISNANQSNFCNMNTMNQSNSLPPVVIQSGALALNKNKEIERGIDNAAFEAGKCKSNLSATGSTASIKPPTYRSLGEFYLHDEPPKYEQITGHKLENNLVGTISEVLSISMFGFVVKHQETETLLGFYKQIFHKSKQIHSFEEI